MANSLVVNKNKGEEVGEMKVLSEEEANAAFWKAVAKMEAGYKCGECAYWKMHAGKDARTFHCFRAYDGGLASATVEADSAACSCYMQAAEETYGKDYFITLTLSAEIVERYGDKAPEVVFRGLQHRLGKQHSILRIVTIPERPKGNGLRVHMLFVDPKKIEGVY